MNRPEHGLDADDPRITAYALGELDGAERETVAMAIAADPTLASVVGEIRALGSELEHEFGRSGTPLGLTSEQRAKIVAASSDRRAPATRRGPTLMRVAAIAVLVLGVGWIVAELSQPAAPSATDVGRTSPDPLRTNRREAVSEPQPDPERADDAADRASAFAEPERNDHTSYETFVPPNISGIPSSDLDAASLMDRVEELFSAELQQPGESQLFSGPDAHRLNLQFDDFWGNTESQRVTPQEVMPPATTPVSEATRSLGKGPTLKLTIPGHPYEKIRNAYLSQVTRAHAPESHDQDSYAPITENPFARVTDAPLSTFSIDVDTASYANVRRMLREGRLPPPDAVRIEELLNYFPYDYPAPHGDAAFSIDIEIASCPWQPDHRLARIGLRGRDIETLAPVARNLVFLVDVSGSMDQPVKLPLLKRALSLLVDHLHTRDRIAIVTYAGTSGCALEPTSCDQREQILAAIDAMTPGGSTNGAAGIELAYELAQQHFDKEGINRVVLATDGDFNVGLSEDGPLTRLIEQQAKSGVFLSVLGFGTGNLKDSKMESLADHGNGNYAYIDSIREARKVLVDEIGGTLVTIAKDVKIQVEFNPSQVAAYRLIGYENRALAAQDFNDDTKDAGEIGAGHRVTALYQIVPVGAPQPGSSVDALKYQPQKPNVPHAAIADELMTVKLRYKQPDGDTSRKLEHGVIDEQKDFAAASTDFRFAAAVAQFGMLLRRSAHCGSATLEGTRTTALGAIGQDSFGHREEFVKLIECAAPLFPR